MHGRSDERREIRLDEGGPLRADAKLRSDHRLGGGRSEADDDARLDDIDLRLQPWPAGIDLRGVRLLVDAPLAARLPLEVLHHIGDVDAAAIDARFLQRLVQEIARRPHKGPALKVFLVPRLLADEHHGGCLLPFAEHGLRSGFPEIAGLAAGGRDLQLLQRWSRWDQRCGGLRLPNGHEEEGSIARASVKRFSLSGNSRGRFDMIAPASRNKSPGGIS